MNEVAVARHGPILKDNEATGLRKVFKYLPGLRDVITKSKMGAKSTNPKTPCFTVFLYYQTPHSYQHMLGIWYVLFVDPVIKRGIQGFQHG